MWFFFAWFFVTCSCYLERKKHPPRKNLHPVGRLFFGLFRRKNHEKSYVNVKILSKNEKTKIFGILIFFKIINVQPVLGAYFRMSKKSKKINILCFYQTFFDSFQGETRKNQKTKMLSCGHSERQIEIFDQRIIYFFVFPLNQETLNRMIF